MRLPGAPPRFSFDVSAREQCVIGDERLQQARALRIDAARCFRLAQGIAGYELAEELEALGRALEIEAANLAAAIA
jgi:hypothetical protein